MRAFVLGLAAASLAASMAMAQTTKDTGAASGNNNQAVATTDANAPQPAHGSNSFTEGQAKDRLEKDGGFSNVTGLMKDQNGVWRGRGQKAGQPVSVWLDYKGNVGSGT